MVRVKLRVNNVDHVLDVSSSERLIDTLRYRLGLMSVKEGCGRGECGSCIVLVNGKPRHSCLTLTATLDGSEVITLEGLAPEGKLHAVQVAFLDTMGVQCGFCTPAFIIMAKALLDHNPDPDREEALEWLSSVLCRCGSYYHYLDAVDVAKKYLSVGKVFFDLDEVRRKYYLKVLEKRGGD